MEIFENFGIEPARLIGQILIWAVLFFVLKKYAFGPIIKVLDDRKKMIEDSVANAEKIRKELEEAEKTRKELITKATQQATALIEEAKKSVGTVTEQKIREATAQAEEIIRKAEQAASQDRDRLMVELKKEMGRLVVATTEKVVGKALSSEDQVRLQKEALQEIS